ncbi:transport protein [Pandoraea communis]|uniref:Transport protein n=2 Tax=Pandoraea communis TaxID=2508297 RepID=A0A5E4WFN1_9BURK|nr:transport protein [Pandoraea communis]
MSPLFAYLSLDFLLAAYLGMWNAMVPIVLLDRFGTAGVVAYEIALAACAVIALPVAASWTERLPRGRVMQCACVTIALSGISRMVIAGVTHGITFWILNDMIAVAAFAVVQPLLGVYPAETVEKTRVLAAFRLKRVTANLGRIGGPLLAGTALLFFPRQYALWCVAALGCCALLLLPRLPRLPTSRPPGTSAPATISVAFRRAFAGFALKVRLPAERCFTLCDMLIGVATAGIVPMLIPQLVQQAALPASQAGWLIAIFVVGSIAGVVIFHPVLSGVLRRRLGYVVIWAALGISLAVATVADTIVLLGASLMSAGVFGACLSMNGIDRRVIAMPSFVRIRVASATLLTTQMASMLSFSLYGITYSADTLDGRWWLYGGLVVIAALSSCLASEPWRLLAENDAGDAVETFYTDRYPEAFDEADPMARDGAA